MDTYLGEIRMFGGNYAPAGWRFCDGSLLPIQGNNELYGLLGTIYGGDGQTNFALPDMRGRVPIHAEPGRNYPQGAAGGAEMVTLTPQVLPAHSHPLHASNSLGTSNTAAGNVLAQTQAIQLYASGQPSAVLNQATLGPSEWQGQPYGSNAPQPHENRQPYQCVTFIIAVMGMIPTTT